ncbi:MAG: protein kinase [Thermoanaerobaculia bacterium]|nr:protein kinase [Thermoanaerobaculia bacterium]
MEGAGADVQRVGHYELLEQIGSGGGGVVWKARDPRLDRRVALKFLGSELIGDREARDRFMREARAASSIDHPNICTIFEVDETLDGHVFIAMAYYGGQTLDQVLASGPLEVKRAVSIAVQIARALSAAHEELIIHRDVKPANVMIAARDTVKLLDFGIAKLRGALLDEESGRAFGTLAYMSPEQLRGDEVDLRSDLWSLGVVLQEMVTGVSPFARDGSALSINAILNETLSPPSALLPGLPKRLDSIVGRALQKLPRARYQSAEELIADLQQLETDVDSGAITARRLGVPNAATSIAVLPFADMSPTKDQEYLCDGIAEEVIGALRAIPQLRVASRTSSFRFKGSLVDVREIGEKLNVRTVLEGSVRRAGDRVRISAQLVNASDGYQLWYQRWDRDLRDALAIEDEIARHIAEALELELTGRAATTYTRPTESTEAWELYLQGRRFFHQHRRKGFEVARQSFMRAIEIDPGYARAWAGIANCSSFLKQYFGAGEETARDADEASAKAIALAPHLAEAHVARGLALSLTARNDEAAAELDEAIAIDPSNYDAHYIKGRVMFALGKHGEAAKQFENACALQPEAYDSWYLLGMASRKLSEERRARNADIECVEAAKKRVRQHPEDTRAWTMGAAVFAELGEPDRAADWVARALAIDPDESIISYNAACVYTGLGRYDDALRCLEISIGRGGPFYGWVENDPDLDPLRNDPRFQELMSRFRPQPS